MDAKQPRPIERAPVPAVEHAPRPEISAERPASERTERVVEMAPSKERSLTTPMLAPSTTAPMTPVVDPELKRIEDALSDGLGDVYKTLPPSMKPAFKQKGEEVARAIQGWMQQTKLKAHKVLRLIREWLGMIPRINPYFLEQQSKIKTDQVMHLAQEEET